VTTPYEVRVAPRTWVGVLTLAEASLAVCQHRDAYGFGYSKWGQESAPVRAVGGTRAIARVSYNGRVWTPERDWQKRTEITGPALHASPVQGGAR
jgi:hypothetical protein